MKKWTCIFELVTAVFICLFVRVIIWCVAQCLLLSAIVARASVVQEAL